MPRPKSFDRDEVLEQAMNLFWDFGYRATSIQDLENHLGINRVSLYREFGSKHDLFLATLDNYSDEVISSGLALLTSSSDGLASIRRFFEMTHGAWARGAWWGRVRGVAARAMGGGVAAPYRSAPSWSGSRGVGGGRLRTSEAYRVS